MAVSVEGIVRSAGAVPATIALIDGRVHIGGLKIKLTLFFFRKQYISSDIAHTIDGFPLT